MHAPSLRFVAILALWMLALSPGTALAQQAPAPSGTSGPAGGAEEMQMTPDLAYQRATAYYEAGRYSDCTQALSDLLTEGSPNRPRTPELVESARIYYAACLMAVGKMKDADEQFRTAIRENPQIGVPSSVVFPQPVVDRFLVIRAAMHEEIQKAEEDRARKEQERIDRERRKSEEEHQRMLELERLSAQETVVSKNERWIASVPFGVGQFQNHDYVLGAVFLTLEVGLVATAITATEIELSLNKQSRGGNAFANQQEADAVTQNARTANIVALSATGAFLLTAIAGVVEAHLAFVPEYPEGTRPRRPGVARNAQRASIDPVIAPSLGGATLGLRGAF